MLRQAKSSGPVWPSPESVFFSASFPKTCPLLFARAVPHEYLKGTPLQKMLATGGVSDVADMQKTRKKLKKAQKKEAEASPLCAPLVGNTDVFNLSVCVKIPFALIAVVGEFVVHAVRKRGG